MSTLDFKIAEARIKEISNQIAELEWQKRNVYKIAIRKCYSEGRIASLRTACGVISFVQTSCLKQFYYAAKLFCTRLLPTDNNLVLVFEQQNRDDSPIGLVVPREAVGVSKDKFGKDYCIARPLDAKYIIAPPVTGYCVMKIYTQEEYITRNCQP